MVSLEQFEPQRQSDTIAPKSSVVKVTSVRQSEEDFVEKCSVLARTHFAIECLRESQVRVLRSLVQAPTVLATLPTGAGKTLLYALPALALESGAVVVICPLISLMRDQVRRMRDAKIPSVLFTSDQSEAERKEAYVQLYSDKTKLIFVSPERFVLPSFLKAIARIKIAMVVIDEAHCVVTWGHGFRPEYRDLGRILGKIRPPRILALTATASLASRRIIAESVFPPESAFEEIVFSPLGKNIFVEAKRVYSEDEKWTSLLAIVRSTDSEKSIVYFQRREQCERAVAALRKDRIHAVAYHAGMKRIERQSIETYLHDSKSRVVVCATLAFGMGIDIPKVGLVVAYGFPGNVEEYFQMIGRAGRGGEPARTVLIWSGSDPKRRYFQFQEAFPEPSVMRESIEKMTPLFPAEGCKQFVSQAQLRSFFGQSEKDALKIVAGVQSALRLVGALEAPAYLEELVVLDFGPSQSPEALMLSLPSGVTRRSLIFDALCALNEPPWRKTLGAKTVITKGSLAAECGISWEKIVEVFDFYQNQGLMKYLVRTYEECRDAVVLRSSLARTLLALPKYSTMRRHFMESLSQLEGLAQSQHCRLSLSEDFFSARKVKGASAGRTSCFQCDLCFSRTSKGSPATRDVFKLFAQSSSR